MSLTTVHDLDFDVRVMLGDTFCQSVCLGVRDLISIIDRDDAAFSDIHPLQEIFQDHILIGAGAAQTPID